MASSSSTPDKAGLLYVTIHPKSTLPPSQFHDWYNNEHGPLRLRLPFVTTGFRYRANDPLSPSPYSSTHHEWMALYDITTMSSLTTPTYTSLRDPNGVQSQRERDVMKQLDVDRKLYDLLAETRSANFKNLMDLDIDKDVSSSVHGDEGNGNILISVVSRPKPDGSGKDAFEKAEHESIEKVKGKRGWLRSRLFVTSDCFGPPDASTVEYLTIHEFAPSTPDPEIPPNSIVRAKTRKYTHHYTFGPAPRDLHSLSLPEAIPAFTSPDQKTTTTTAKAHPLNLPFPSVSSYITTPDPHPTTLPYTLTGPPTPTAPVLILLNSILTTPDIWNGFLSTFLSPSNPKFASNSKYRILSYNMRGRFGPSLTSPNATVTIDVLAQDVTSLMNALRIPRAHTAIGVSLGGATALCLGVRAPFNTRITSFIACDTSMKSPAGNAQAWTDRITIAEKENLAVSPTSISPFSFSSKEATSIVGNNLAEATVNRWFTPPSLDPDSPLRKEVDRVKEMVKGNDLDGFKESVRALWEYDLSGDVKRFDGGGGGGGKGERERERKGLFVVGSGDGALPGSMKGMAESLGSEGGKLVVVEGAGHLPMVERVGEFTRVVEGFLEG